MRGCTLSEIHDSGTTLTCDLFGCFAAAGSAGVSAGRGRFVEAEVVAITVRVCFTILPLRSSLEMVEICWNGSGACFRTDLTIRSLRRGFDMLRGVEIIEGDATRGGKQDEGVERVNLKTGQFNPSRQRATGGLRTKARSLRPVSCKWNAPLQFRNYNLTTTIYICCNPSYVYLKYKPEY